VSKPAELPDEAGQREQNPDDGHDVFEVGHAVAYRRGPDTFP